MGFVLLIVLIILLLGAYPRQSTYSEGWGYAPSGTVGLILLIVLILLLLGRIPYGF